jgi:hypothetical protein
MVNRLVLVCTGLGESQDGVGDYCRTFSKVLNGMGINCALLALNDGRTEKIESSALHCHQTTIPLLRLPHILSRREKLSAASEFLGTFAPDWISLQFVCYGFNPKGIVLRDLRWLPRLFAPYRLQLMFHEIWIGENIHHTRSAVAIGMVQRESIRWLVSLLRPKLTHASNVRYAKILESIDVAAKLLPLFSNIPVTAQDGSSWVLPALRAKGAPDIASDRGRYWLFGTFGGVIQKWPFAELFNHLQDIAHRAHRVPVIVAMGRTGADPDMTIAAWRAAFPSIHFAWLGVLPPEAISEVMNTIDFAFTSHEHYAIGKSGASAAFLEHGVPVITSWGRDTTFPDVAEPPFDQIIWYNDDTLEHRLLHPPLRVRSVDRPKQIATRLLQDLEEAS